VPAKRGGQAWVAAVGFVAGDPPARQSAGQRGLDQPAGQLWLGGESDGVGHCCLGTSLWVLSPRFRQVEGHVEQGVPSRCRIRQMHGELAVLDLPGGAGVLPLNSDGVDAL
jgi:hypothetical protein